MPMPTPLYSISSATYGVAIEATGYKDPGRLAVLKILFLLWLVGLLLFVPYGIYYLFTEASREQYALIITLLLFWVLGFWALVTPLLSAWKVRQIFGALEQVHNSEQLRELVESPNSRDVAIDLIASENHVPRFIARRVYDSLLKRLNG